MPKRRANANSRRFFDEFASVRVSRLRATGLIDPAKQQAVIAFGDKQKLMGTAHVHFPKRRRLQLFPLPEVRRARGHPLPRRRRAAMRQMLRRYGHRVPHRNGLRQERAQAGKGQSSRPAHREGRNR
jgi:hypothetical protein